MISFIRSNAVWDTIVVDKALCKSMDGSFGRSTVGRESTSRILSYFSKNKALLLWQNWLNALNQLQRTSWSTQNGGILETPVDFCYWQIGHSPAGIKWKPMSQSPCTISIPTFGYTAHESASNDKHGWTKKLTDIPEISHPLCLITKILLC